MKHYQVAALSLLAISCFAPVLADSERDARKGIQARYDAFNRAYMQKDFKKVGEVFSPGCVFHLGSEGRYMTASRALKGMAALSKGLTVSNAKTRIVSIEAKGEEFVVVATWEGDSKYVSPVEGSKEDPPRKGKGRQAYRDTWKRTENGWQITNRDIGQDVDDLKGQPAPPKAPNSPKTPDQKK